MWLQLHYTCSGWMRIAHLNMSDQFQQCPDAWRFIPTPRRMCARQTSQDGSCDAVIFPTHGLQYSHVCGRLIGYQSGHPDIFNSFDIESYYVDGISITHWAPGSRQHVWTFAGSHSAGDCPCSHSQGIPPFVGPDYFCETGDDDDVSGITVHINDPLCGSGMAKTVYLQQSSLVLQAAAPGHN